MIKRLSQALMGAGVFCLFVTGCNPIDDPASSKEDVGSMRLPQIIEGKYGFVRYHLAFPENLTFADVIVVGRDAIGGYSANTEYWYVETSSLQYLGDEDLTVTHDEDQEGTPPSLSGDQEFTQPVHLTWNSFSSDPVSVGNLYGGANCQLRIKAEAGEVTRLTWYQTIDEETAPENVGPDGTFTAVSGSVSVPSGKDGYYIDATIE
jgi:hypothetical protein